jgi:general stress protein YciG
MSDDSNGVKSKRGFAALDPEARRAISSKGGKSAHAQGVAHQWTSEKAAAAGRKGGAVTRERRRIRLETQVNEIVSKFLDDKAETIPSPPPEEVIDG